MEVKRYILHLVNRHGLVIDVFCEVLFGLGLYLFSISCSADGTPAQQKCFTTYIAYAATIIGIVSWFISKRIQSHNGKSIKELEEEIARCKSLYDPTYLYDIFNGYLYSLSRRLGFGRNPINSERLTLYIHDKNCSFVPFSRYSQNPEYAKKGRTHYPDSEGCISYAWANGWHFDNQFPTQNGAYSKYNKEKYSIQRDTVTTLTMRSKLFACMRIDCDSEKLGVLVLESTDTDRFDEVDVKLELESQSDYLSQMLKRFHSNIPTLNEAMASGV